MDTSPLPPALRDAIAAQHHTRPPAALEQRPARRGDLAVVTHEHVTRIVCVTRVEATHLVGVLCSNETEMATDHDVVIERRGTYDLLLEAECYLVVLADQVAGIVGGLDLDAVNAVRDSLPTDAASVEAFAGRAGYRVGLPLGGIDDPRRAFMERELDDVVVLRHRAHKVLLGDWNPGYPPPASRPN